MTADEARPGTDAAVAGGPFAVPIFRRIWLAGLVGNFGSLIQTVGASWMMTSLTPSPVMVTLVQSSTVLPIMLLALVAGAVADNLPRRLVMLVAQVTMLTASTLLSLCAFAGVMTPALLLAFTFVIGCGVAVNAPAAAASVGDMVPRAILPGAVAMSSMGFNIARSVGPAIGGVIVASAGPAVAFLVNAVSYVGLIVVLLSWRPAYPQRMLPREPLLPSVTGGLRYVAMSPHLRLVMVRAACFGIFASGGSALMPLIARQLLNGGPGMFGLLSAAFGVGAVGGALLVGRLRGRLQSEQIVRLATVALATGTAVAGLSEAAWLTIAAMMISGFGWVIGFSTFNILVQLASPKWVAGRALACYQMCAFGAMAVGGWLIGEVTAVAGVAATLLLVGAVQAANLLVGLMLPTEDPGALDLDPVFHAYTPETSVPVSPRSGPVIITFTYHIAPDRVREFLDLMADFRRIRRRDGAGRWVLMRDLNHEDQWVERFELPTWVDYQRFIARRTRDDVGILQRIVDIHLGPEPPAIRRLVERQTGRPPIEVDPEPSTEPQRLM